MNSDSDKAAAILGQHYPQVDSRHPRDYFGEVGSARDALCYAWLYWPDVVEYMGALFVLLERGQEQFVRGRLEPIRSRGGRLSGPQWSDLVRSFNTFEVSSLFRLWPAGAYGDVVECLAPILRETWEQRLRSAYPERRIEVSVVDDDPALEVAIQVNQELPDVEWGKAATDVG
ncbi:hypothetical protein [Saccharomonospora azurea]|uniref:hypothetical protein n=1 Tax=Saccharomonospora azurea TaxID=40988 RepID=UPI00240A676F|nr:hypothetical protein [Saccharomonospora azurea]